MVRAGLRGVAGGRFSGEGFEIERSLPAGHVAAALVMARRLELARLLDRQPSRERDLVFGDDLPAGDRAGVEAGDREQALDQSTLASELGVDGCRRGRPVRGARLAWGPVRSGSRIGSRVGIWKDGELVLYDVSSSYFEGRSCPLARLGYSRDGRRGTAADHLWAVVRQGRPAGRGRGLLAASSTTRRRCLSQVKKLKQRFGLATVVVGLRPWHGHEGQHERAWPRPTEWGWITALKAPQISEACQPAGRCSCRFLTSTTWLRSPPRRTTRVSGSLSVATRWSRSSAPANAKTLLAATEKGLQADRTARRLAGRCRERPRSACAVGPAAKRYRMRETLRTSRSATRRFSFERKTAADRGRSCPRRHLRPAHQRPPLPSSRADEVVRSYKQLEAGRTRLQNPQRPRARNPPDPPPPRRARPRPRLPLHARLLPHLAPTPSLGPSALQRRTATNPTRPRRQSPPLERRPTKSPNQTHPRPANAATATKACSPNSPP